MAAAQAWLDTAANAPFFLWLHLFDAHQPLRPPAVYRDAVAPKGQAPRRERVRYLRDEPHVTLGPGPGPDGRVAFRHGAKGLLRLHDACDGEIRFVDSELARLFDDLARRGLAEGTLWIVTSDHGEGLENHGYKSHGKNLYDEQVRVPLLFFSEGGALVAGRVDSLALHVDLLPTLAEWVGRADWLREHEPRAQGRSLVPLLEGRPSSAGDREALIERRSYAPEDRRRRRSSSSSRRAANSRGRRSTSS